MRCAMRDVVTKVIAATTVTAVTAVTTADAAIGTI